MTDEMIGGMIGETTGESLGGVIVDTIIGMTGVETAETNGGQSLDPSDEENAHHRRPRQSLKRRYYSERNHVQLYHKSLLTLTRYITANQVTSR